MHIDIKAYEFHPQDDDVEVHIDWDTHRFVIAEGYARWRNHDTKEVGPPARIDEVWMSEETARRIHLEMGKLLDESDDTRS